jgi:hypothetical protein
MMMTLNACCSWVTDEQSLEEKRRREKKGRGWRHSFSCLSHSTSHWLWAFLCTKIALIPHFLDCLMLPVVASSFLLFTLLLPLQSLPALLLFTCQPTSNSARYSFPVNGKERVNNWTLSLWDSSVPLTHTLTLSIFSPDSLHAKTTSCVFTPERLLFAGLLMHQIPFPFPLFLRFTLNTH